MAQITTPGAILDMSTNSTWRGSDLSNGYLVVGDGIPRFKSSYQKLTIAAATTAITPGGVAFGSGVFVNPALKATAPLSVTTNMPTNGKLYGILCMEQGVATGFPTWKDANWGFCIPQSAKAKIALSGSTVSYKFAYATGTGTGAPTVKFNNMLWSNKLWISNTTGLPVIADATGLDANGKPELAGCTYAGKLLQFFAENQAATFTLDFA